MDDLTFDRAMEIQARDIMRWGTVLNDNTLASVLSMVNSCNKKGYNTSYDVCRGDAIANYISILSYDNIRIK